MTAASTTASHHDRPGMAAYGTVALVLLVFGYGLSQLVGRSAGDVEPTSLLGPLYGQVALTGVVWLMMVSVRNYAILRELVDHNYYAAYRGSIDNDWVERPARAFNNLLQVPVLFFVACLLMMQTGKFDAAQLSLAWTFVALRVLHAVVYIGWNHVPTRFTTWLMSGIVLATLWFRLAAL